MKKILFCILIFTAKNLQAQTFIPYANMDLGINFPNLSKENSNYSPDEELRILGYTKNPFNKIRPLFCLSVGVQLNDVLINYDCIGFEYNQRAVVSNYYPSMLGGRLLYGYHFSNSFALLGTYGRYFSFKSSDNHALNHWVNGFSLRLHYKEKASLEISKVEFFQITFGCMVQIKKND